MTRIYLLFIRRVGLSSETFHPRKTSFRVPWLAIAIMASCFGWYFLAAEPNADFQQDSMAAPLSADELLRWDSFSQILDSEMKAQTLDNALSAVSFIRGCVSKLPYRDEVHRRDANCYLDTAENHLTACYVGRRDHPSYWQAEFTKALERIPKYAGQIVAPPLDIDEI